ncbi:hypothetical protein E5288_WYG010694 [Bos mutus]|uniref:Uncharacterized protein n=1 Tax=Bos mutus TaxID=72004 RepID=A0A6B0RY86_9CETA|nr:hypothetical protein [Bos mutus]
MGAIIQTRILSRAERNFPYSWLRSRAPSGRLQPGIESAFIQKTLPGGPRNPTLDSAFPLGVGVRAPKRPRSHRKTETLRAGVRANSASDHAVALARAEQRTAVVPRPRCSGWVGSRRKRTHASGEGEPAGPRLGEAARSPQPRKRILGLTCLPVPGSAQLRASFRQPAVRDGLASAPGTGAAGRQLGVPRPSDGRETRNSCRGCPGLRV